MPPRLSLPLVASVTAAMSVRDQRRLRSVERLAAAALQTILNAIDANDPQTGMHVRRVAAYALIIADAADCNEGRQRATERVALFHDIGKIDAALFDIVHDGKRLTPDERIAIATHPLRGAQVLAPLATFYPELPAGVLAHHERWDGTGYPRGLRGLEIPVEARIVMLADTFDAVAHARHYRRGRGMVAAARVIAEGRGTHFDPDLADLMLFPPVLSRLVRERVTHTERQAVSHENDHKTPDISFRWRVESPHSRRISPARDVG